MLKYCPMNRREFVKQVGLSLAAGWAGGRLIWPFNVGAAVPELHLALLADAHLKDGNERRPEAQALARAVVEIRALSPPPDLALFAGDLAHRGQPAALDLGREILADLPAPCWAVRGEGDGGPGGESAWVRFWGEPWFSRSFQGFQLLGLDTFLHPAPGGPVFMIGADQRRWLARELARLSADTPLVILSHAPLARLFHPWQEWTGDGPEVARLLAKFPQVLCLHGHVHRAGIWETVIREQGPQWGAGNIELNSSHCCRTACLSSLTQYPKPGTQAHLSLPATAWPRPQAIQGTPAVWRPGQDNRGCGWGMVIVGSTSRRFHPHLWQA